MGASDIVKFSGRDIEFLTLYAQTGVVRWAAKKAGISKNHAYDLLSDPDAQAYIAEARRRVKESGEAVLERLIDERERLVLEVFDRVRTITLKLFDAIESDIDGGERGVDAVVRAYEAVCRSLQYVFNIFEIAGRERIFQQLEERIREYEALLSGTSALMPPSDKLN